MEQGLAAVTRLCEQKSRYDWQSVCRGVEPTLGLVTRYYFLSEGRRLKVAILFLWCDLSDERSGLPFGILSL
jgi:hypothetical protein